MVLLHVFDANHGPSFIQKVGEAGTVFFQQNIELMELRIAQVLHT